MPKSRHLRRLSASIAVGSVLSLAIAPPLLSGCAARTRDGVDRPASDAPRTTTPVVNPDAPEESAGLVAILDGRTIAWKDLRAPAAELAGQQLLRDAVLDLRLERRLAERGIRLDASASAAEEAILLATLDADRARALELLGAIRSRQGLGPTRYPALLRRNAALRALVAQDVRIDEGSIANAFDMLHGAKRSARLAVLPSLGEAERFAADVKAGEAFTDLAVARSLDESAARGGLLAPIARRDPSYPVRCEDVVRRSQERLLMDALARELSALDGVTIFDRAFDAPAR